MFMLRWWLQLDIWGVVFDSNLELSFRYKAIRIHQYVLCVKPLRGVHTGSEASYPVAHLHVYLPVDSSKSAQNVSFWLQTWISLFWHLSNSTMNRNNTVAKPEEVIGKLDTAFSVVLSTVFWSTSETYLCNWYRRPCSLLRMYMYMSPEY